jgi:hypothetical protein
VPEYIVYRGNPADPDGRRAVARVEAATAKDACRLAGKDLSLDPGERLSAEPAAAVDEKEVQLNRTSRDLARDTRGGEGPTPES